MGRKLSFEELPILVWLEPFSNIRELSGTQQQTYKNCYEFLVKLRSITYG